MAPSDAAGRPLTDFEQVLLGVIASEPRSGYGLKKMFNASPASVYQPSPGALYPALRRLEDRGLLRAEKRVSSGRRTQRLYQVTEAGRAVHVDWLRRPVVPDTVVADLGLHLMRFALMENHLEREAVLAFLRDLADALDGFVSGVEQFVASARGRSLPQHAQLALEHGIVTHRASLEWACSALAALAEPPARLVPPGSAGSGTAGRPHVVTPAARRKIMPDDCDRPSGAIR
jgi:DNA-binding PadR family transcriptional regulator